MVICRHFLWIIASLHGPNGLLALLSCSLFWVYQFAVTAILSNTIFKRLFLRSSLGLLMACGVSISSAQVFVASDGLEINSCSGTFYDSGSAAGNYGSSESFTVVLCPTGGSGAGPASSVKFTQFAVQPLAVPMYW